MACSAALAVAGGAVAQEAISTAANASGGGAPAQASPPGTPIVLSNRTNERDDRGPLPIGPCGGVKITDDGRAQPDKSPHGAVWGGVGTHGYREAGGAVCVPLGDSGRVSIVVDDTRWGHR